jgi:5'/3'-nucleotidase SurE
MAPKDLSTARILVVNDDGIMAPGLKVLERIAKSISNDVWVCAPEVEQSGMSHAFTMTGAIRVQRLNRRRFAISGSPTDCVLLAVNELIEGREPDLVLSGVNRGANLAEEVIYSGTVAGAMEGALLGIRSIALSQVTSADRKIDWDATQKLGADVIRQLLAKDWTRDVFMNVNFPACKAEEVKGISVVPQGRRSAGYEIHQITPIRGREYYMLGESQRGIDLRRGDSDYKAVDRNEIAVTPLHVDLTHRGSLTTIRSDFAKKKPRR